MKKMSCLLMFCAVFLLIVTLGGCAKKVATTSQAIEVKEKPVAPPPQEVTQKEQPPVIEEQPIVRESEAVMLKDIYFDFDRSDMRPDARTVLENDARWFKANPRARVKIEGQCDERGTTEYNLALGQRRAEATRRFLVALGIAETRLSTISYGEERPVCSEHNEDCWWKNRRSHFLAESR